MRRIWLFYKSVFRFIAYFILDALIFLAVWIRNVDAGDRRILLIRLDAIGDYVLFRNFIEVIKRSDRYRDYKITLCGNILWKDMAEAFDKKYIDRFIWINRNTFINSFLYRCKIIAEVASVGYDVAIQPTYSREYYYGDNIIKFANAKEKIGSVGDLRNITKWQKKYSDKYYTKFVPAKNGTIFEFYRNKEFFENCLGANIEMPRPFLDVSMIKAGFDIPAKGYAVLFVGASNIYQRWRPEYYSEVAKCIYEHYGFQIVICGAEADKAEAKIIKDLCVDLKILDYTGQTSLTDLALLISRATLVVSNETMAPHLSVAVGTPVVVIANHFGRFLPYPEEVTDIHYVCYHPAIDRNPECYQNLADIYGDSSKLSINEIQPQRVVEVVEKCLLKGKNSCRSVVS
jgi:ADP-heptose:LPS heptosyltransferase